MKFNPAPGIFIERIYKGWVEYYNNFAQGSWHGICNTATKYETKEAAQKDIDDLAYQYPEATFRIIEL